MPSHRNKKILIAIYAILVVLVLGIAFGAWLSFAPASTVKNSILKTFPFPLVSINGQPVAAKDYLLRLQSAEKFYRDSKEPSDLPEQIYNKLIYDTEVAQLAKTRKVSVSQKEIDSEYLRLAESVKNSGHMSMSDYFRQYGLSEQDYKNKLIKPELLKQHLQTWFNSQKDLNPQSYRTIDQAMSVLSAGQDFESVAKSYSEDQRTSVLGGNLGFVEINSLLPELREQIDASKAGESKVMASRSGIQIVKILAKDNNGTAGAPRVQLQAIVVNTQNFDGWLTEQTKSFSIHKFIKNY